MYRVRGASVDKSVFSYGRASVFVKRGSNIKLGKNVVLASTIASNNLEIRGRVILRTFHENALISIGQDSGLSGASISSASRIDIGERVLLGSGVIITDSDHHVVSPPPGISRRHLGFPKPKVSDGIFIESDVFVGARSIILKGVRIGTGSVIGAGSVVTCDIPPQSIAAGNPCKVVRQIS
jgi:acetyltransferase-like isoleucine patch superfamily enzyme